MKRLAAILFLALPFGCCSPKSATNTAVAAAVPTAQYHVVRHIPIGGVGGWDYLTVDSATHRAYVSHGDHVEVVDLNSGQSAGTIADTQGVHGIALAPSLHRGFVSAGRTSTVTIFDTETLKTISLVKTGERPDAIAFDPFSSRVFTFNAGTKDSTAIDAASGIVAGTIPLGGKPEFAVADGKGLVFVNVEDTSEIAAIDSKTLTVVKRWKLEGCEEPSGLAMDRVTRRLFSGCDNEVMAISDADAGRVVATVPIGEGVDANAFDPATSLAFSSNGKDGTLTVVHEVSGDKFEVVGNIPTQKGARTMALDEGTHHVYLATAQFGETPAPTTEHPHPRPAIVPGTFELLEVAP